MLSPDDVLLRPHQVVLVGASTLNGTVAQVLSNPMRVRVLDDEGVPMSNRVVAFTAAGGTVTPATATTDASGEALATSWTLPALSGTHTLSARAQKKDDDDPEPTAVVTAQVTPGPATTITATNSAASAPVNTTLLVSVTARDQYGNGVPGVRVSAQPGESGTNAAITTNNPETTNAAGVAPFTWRLDTLVRVNTLRFAGVDLPSLTTTTSAQGTAGTPTRLTSVSQRSQNGLPGTAVASVPEVRVADQYDNPVAGASVLFSVPVSNGTITPVSGSCTSSTSCTVATGADGRAKLGSWVLPAVMGSYTLNVTVASGSLTLTPPFTVDASRDLRVNGLTIPATGNIGESIQVSASVANVGSIDAPATTVVFRFSSDNLVSTSDVQALPSCTVPALVGGATYSCNQDITVPASLTAGSWYVGAVIDEGNTITEVDESNNSRASLNTISLSLTQPAAPTNLAATPSVGGVTLTWTDNSTNESGFRIERCTGSSCTSFFETGIVGANVSTYSVTSLSTGFSYSFRVRAYNAAGNSGYSNTATSSPLVSGIDLQATSVTAPSAITTSVAFNIQATVLNSGNTPTGAFAVAFYLSTNDIISTGDTYIGSCSSSGLGAASNVSMTCSVTVPTTTTSGFYYLGAIVDANSQVAEVDEFNNAVATTTTSSVAPAPPSSPSSLITSTISASQINLAWTDNSSNEDGFRIERCAGSGCTNFTEIMTVATNTTSFSNTGLSAATTYRYRVRSYNAGGNSGYSNTADATTADPPAAPSSLTVTGTFAGQIDLAWTDNSGNESGFKVERCMGPGCTDFAEIASVAANTTTYSSSGLNTATEYGFRVRSFSAGGNSNYSNVVTALTASNLPNGNFSGGSTSWTLSGTAATSTSLSTYRTSPGLAMLASDASGNGVDNASGELYQSFTVPAGKTSATLTFWYCITTSEATSATIYDQVTARIRNSLGSNLALVMQRSNLDKVSACGLTSTAANRGYTQFTFDMTPYVGQTIQIYFSAISDGSLPTVFRIDDVEVNWIP